MTRTLLLGAGIVTLAAAWLGPLPGLAPHDFSAHMTMHMAVVAVAAPLIAFGVAGHRLDPTHRYPALFSPIPASLVELAVGGVSYLAGGLWLSMRLLQARQAAHGEMA